MGRRFGLLLSNTTTGDDNGNYLLVNYTMGPQLMRGGHIRLSNPGSISVVIEGTELPQHLMRLFNQVVNLYNALSDSPQKRTGTGYTNNDAQHPQAHDNVSLMSHQIACKVATELILTLRSIYQIGAAKGLGWAIALGHSTRLAFIHMPFRAVARS